jgi:hypothetical protein
MDKRTCLFSCVLVSILSSTSVFAQGFGYGLLPSAPTSADNIKLISSLDFTCGGILFFTGNQYRVSMSQNNITVTLGERNNGVLPTCPPPPATGLLEFDLGRLPAGSYTLTVAEMRLQHGSFFENFPFTVTDARATKAAPYVRLDYSGSWWDPADPGWGLFIWQDAKSATDNLLVAWFTYTPDGKPMWYVTQPGWTSATATTTAPLVQVSRLPGLNSPPPTAQQPNVTAGTASLDFTNTGTADVGKITYTFTGGATLTRNIQRFKP